MGYEVYCVFLNCKVQLILHVVIMRALFLVMVANIVSWRTHTPSSYG